jgi:hypothetical protein
MAGRSSERLTFRVEEIRIPFPDSISKVAESREFALADLACVAIAGAWWAFAPQAGTWPLVIALVPWGIRLAAGKFPIRRTALDIPIVLFLLTAGVGVWAAYDRTAAWSKFWLIAAGVLLFYVIASPRYRDVWAVVGFLSIGGVVLAVYYLFSPPAIEPDTVAGILVVIFPFTIAWGWNQWRRRQMHLMIGASVIGVLMVLVMIMSRERGVWLGLGLLAVLLPLSVGFKAIVHRRQRVFVAIGMALSWLLIGWVFTILPPAHGTVEKYLDKFSPRLEGNINTAYLAVEFPFIGGGLGSYAGLYSKYILVIPWLFQEHGHNLFLDVAVEQGWIGLAALLWIYIGSGWMVIRDWTSEDRFLGQRALRGAALCSLFLLIFHNLTEDALYSAQGVVCLFVVPGLSFLVSLKTNEQEYTPSVKTTVLQRHRRTIIAASGVTLLLAIGLWRSLTAVFYANLGVVEMARVHLAGWPTQWVDGERLLAVIGPAEAIFQKALHYNPKQATALYRLGMIASEQREFEQARQFLSGAYEVYPSHYGIRKLLGYSYLWLGNVDEAANLLRPDSETLKELDYYTYWWTTQNQGELSALAQQLTTRLIKNIERSGRP